MKLFQEKNSKKCFPESFNINTKEATNTLGIANAFNLNSFFTNIGTNIVNNYSLNKDFKHSLEEYLNCKFALNNVDETNCAKNNRESSV